MRVLAVLALVIVALAGVFISLQPGIGDVIETLDEEGRTFRVRVESRIETCGWFPCLPGAYYVFLSSPKGGDRWRPIMTFRHDDPNPIPRNNIRFVNDRVAYVFMGWMYAVTTDAGSTWSVWTAETDLPGWQCCHYGYISDVTINADGTGTMTIDASPYRPDDAPILTTTDFGRHWNAPNTPR